jgi:hypothetical protein
VVEDVARLGCRNWKVVALNREGWRKLLKEAEAHPGLQRRWRERETRWYINLPLLLQVSAFSARVRNDIPEDDRENRNT